MFDTVEAAVISSPVNRRYFSGFTGTEATLILTKQEKFILVDGRYTIQAREQTDFTVISGSLAEHLKSYQTIGYEEEYLTVAQFARLNRDSEAEWTGISKEIETARMVKSEWEIDQIRMAQEITDRAFTHILGVLRPGVTEREIALELEFFMRKNGAEGLSFETIVASGLRSAMPHGTATDKKIESGDLVTMDFGCLYNGYCSDMTRTVAVGAVSEELQKIYRVVLSAQAAALSALHAGMTGTEGDKAARDVIEAAGYGSYFTHALGHSLGLEIHEEPRLSPKYGEVLGESVMITVEPGIYIEGTGGVRIEDLCVLRQDGAENLTKSKKDLIIL